MSSINCNQPAQQAQPIGAHSMQHQPQPVISKPLTIEDNGGTTQPVSTKHRQKQLTESKRVNMILGMSTRMRKFSQENINVLDVGQAKDGCFSAKSEASFQIGGQGGGGQEYDVEKSGCSVKLKSYKEDVADIESSFMRKIRNLQARIKNIDLNHQTTIYKLKKQQSKLTHENTQIKQQLRKLNPDLYNQIISNMVEKNSSDSSFSSHSSSSNGNGKRKKDKDKDNDEWMPVMSKIQEIRYDGQKMCEKIKVCQQNLKKKEKQLDGKYLDDSVSPVGKDKKNKLLRKFSIPVDNLKNLQHDFIADRLSKMPQQN